MSALLRGMALIRYYADDVDAAARWYADLLGVDPYYVTEAYQEFRLGDHSQELGILDRRYSPGTAEPGGAVLSWHVDDLDAAIARLTAAGARI